MPPHSSLAQSPTETTRTSSPYFSPNRAIAPESCACCCVITAARTGKSSSNSALTRASTSISTEGGTAEVALKSNRNRPGAFSDPACVALSPSASRMALWTMWVAVCAREMDRRRSTSTSESASSPAATSPSRTVPRCTIMPLIGDCTSRTSKTAPPASRISPASASCPPPSA